MNRLKALLPRILLTLISLLVLALLTNWARGMRRENKRLQESLQNINQRLLDFKTADDRIGSQTRVMSLRLEELSMLYPQILAEIENLKINPERTVQVTSTITQNEKQITTILRDSLIRDTVLVRVFEFEDSYYSVRGVAEADTQHVDICSRDTLIQVVYRGRRRHPWMWILSPRDLEQRIAFKNPNASVEYSRTIQIHK